MNMNKIRQIAEEQMDIYNETGETDGMIGFESEESGQFIINPFVDESCMYDVEPVEYYGQAFLDSDFATIE